MTKIVFLNKIMIFMIIIFCVSCTVEEMATDGVYYQNMVTVISQDVTTTRSGSQYLPKNTVLKPFAIGQYEVTYELYFAVYDWSKANGYNIVNGGCAGSIGEQGGVPEAQGSDRRYHPVSTISWWDAVAFCNAYSEIEGKRPVYYIDAEYTQVVRTSAQDNLGSLARPYIYAASSGNQNPINCTADGYRIPSLAEWEFAARGADATDTTNWNYKYPGSNTLTEVAVSFSDSTFAVGSKKANSLGLYDMVGNEWEFNDAFSIDTVSSSRGCCYSGDMESAFDYSWLFGSCIGFGAYQNLPWFGIRVARSLL